MKRMTGRYSGLLLAAAGVVALFGASFTGPVTSAPAPRARAVHTVADQSDDPDDDSDGPDDSASAGPSGPPDKTEPTRSGLRGIGGLPHTVLSNPGAAVGGLASTLNQVALSPNRQIVQSAAQTVGAGQTSDFELTCPAPFQVVNGGESNSGNAVVLRKNYPVTTATSTAWHVQVRNEDAGAATYRVYADCINGLTQYQRASNLNAEVDPGSGRDDVVGCPTGTLALGGGYSIETPDELALTSSHGYGIRWFLDWRNISSSVARVSTYATCAAGASASEQVNVDAGSAEYQRGEANCGTTQEGLAGGWKLHNQDQYIIVTDSYPTGTGQVIYAHNPNSAARWQVDVNCGTVP